MLRRYNMSYLENLCTIIIGFTVITTVSPFAIDQLLYVFFESPTIYEKHTFDKTAAIFANPHYDVALPNVLYVPGYQDSPFSASSQLIIDAYFKKGGFNMFALDWSTLAAGSYTDAVVAAVEAGTLVGVLYLDFFENGIPPSHIQVIGHDIGAHLLGQAGRTILANSNGAYRLERITGLDPAIQLYYPAAEGIQHITPDDALYVDIIHTDGGEIHKNGGGYATTQLTGTADFFANKGRRFQPGCPFGIFVIRSDDDLCSHRRAIQLWAESVDTPSSIFTATMSGNSSITSRMGFHSPITTMPGKYELLTNAAPPFSRS